MQRLPYKSLGLLCDCSPKGHLEALELQICAVSDALRAPEHVLLHSEVFLPVACVGSCSGALLLQRMPSLAASSVSTDTKLREGQKVADGLAARFIEDEGPRHTAKKMSLVCV